eukprot:2973753-Lingulodinium_polyedra.AAC.1
MAAVRAARRNPASSCTGGAPQAAPYRPAAVPAAAPITQRTRKGTGRRASREKRPTASLTRSA